MRKMHICLEEKGLARSGEKRYIKGQIMLRRGIYEFFGVPAPFWAKFWSYVSQT